MKVIGVNIETVSQLARGGVRACVWGIISSVPLEKRKNVKINSTGKIDNIRKPRFGTNDGHDAKKLSK